MIEPAWVWPRAAYIHVPFCAHRCGYCDFAIAVGKDDAIDRYLDALLAELATLGTPQPVQTIFIGGGTPSHLNPSQLERLLDFILHWLPSLPHHEFSIEANPDSLTADKIAILADRGVNRVSLGAQSFRPDVLQVLERTHDPAEVARAFDRIRKRIDNVSLDLIFGVPGQSILDWRADLAEALALAPSHFSTYGLTYEKGTPLWKQRQRGSLLPLAEDAELELYRIAIDELTAAGFEHYEISNFARPGRRCRHNETYWANEAYFGVGMGAARYVRGRRELNTRDLDAYIRRCLAGEPPTHQSEQLSADEMAKETMAVQLRRCEGIDRRQFQERTGIALDTVAGGAIARHVELGLLADDGKSVLLTREGKFVADAVIERLL